MNIDPYNLDPFTRAYVECALWAELDQSDPNTGGQPLDENYNVKDISQEALKKMSEDCRKFLNEHQKDILDSSLSHDDALARAGHNFFLSRCSHGTGFFDEDTQPEEVRERLQDAAQAFGEVHLEVGDDKKIYIL
jgi:hypothetical protein